MSTRLDAAMFRLVRKLPYLAHAVYSIIPVQTDKLPHGIGAASDKYWRVYWDPEIWDKWSLDECEGVLWHEVYGHLVRSHVVRAEVMHVGPENALIWNICSDAEINQEAKDQGITLPEDSVTLEKLRSLSGEKWEAGLLAEEYYNVLPKKEVKIKTPCNCGSGAHGQKEPWEQDGGEKVNPVEAEIVREKVAQSVREAGNAPDSLQRWAGSRVPTVRWEKELACQLRASLSYKSGMTDSTYDRLSRRESEILMPSPIAYVPDAGLYIDTSGSMTESDLAIAISEAGGVLRCLGGELNVYTLDTEVHTVQKVRSKNQIRMVGGGGTDMCTAIYHSKHAVTIIVTDGYTPWPGKAPDHTKVIVVKTQEGGTSPSWARTVHVN